LHDSHESTAQAFGTAASLHACGSDCTRCVRIRHQLSIRTPVDTQQGKIFKNMKIHSGLCSTGCSQRQSCRTASTHHHTNLWAPSTHIAQNCSCRASLPSLNPAYVPDAIVAASSYPAKQTGYSSSSSSSNRGTSPSQQQLAGLQKRSLLLGVAASIGLSLLPNGAAVAASGMHASCVAAA
jgi:hypothetical protein